MCPCATLIFKKKKNAFKCFFFLSHKIQLIRFHYTPCVCVFQQMVICWSDLCIHWCIDWCMWNLLFHLRQQTVSTDNKQFQQRTNSGQQSRWSCGAVLCYGLCARTTTSRCEISYEALLMYQNKHKILKTVVLIVCYYSSRVNNFQHLCGLTRPGCNTLHLFNEALNKQEQEV